MVKRLLRKNKTDKKVEDQDYEELMKKVKNSIKYFSTKRTVLGFTPQDMESFMGMKVHQILRRGLYDAEKGHWRFFNKVFNNLINDVNRCKDDYLAGNRGIKKCDEDGLDELENSDDNVISKYVKR